MIFRHNKIGTGHFDTTLCWLESAEIRICSDQNLRKPESVQARIGAEKK